MAYDRDDDFRRRADTERRRSQQGGGERWQQGDEHRQQGSGQHRAERFGGDFSESRQVRGWDDEQDAGRGGTFGMGTDPSVNYGGAQRGYYGDEPGSTQLGYGAHNDWPARRFGGHLGERDGERSDAGRRRRGGSYGGGERGYAEGGRDFWDKASDEVSSWFGDEEAERRREMDRHRGRGPKNYVRSDERIRDDINDRLTDDGWVDASNIEVEVKDREVTLSGTVDSRSAKRRAEDIAEAVSGVVNVQNNLRVKSGDDASNTSLGSPRSSTAI